MPVKTKIYRVGGEVAEMDAIDARHALQNHPNEWFQTAADAKAATPKKEVAPAPATTPATSSTPTTGTTPAATVTTEQNPATATAKPALEAKHRGGGSYSVVDADGKEVLEKLTKEDAETFNAMSDEDKAEYIKAETAKN